MKYAGRLDVLGIVDPLSEVPSLYLHRRGRSSTLRRGQLIVAFLAEQAMNAADPGSRGRWTNIENFIQV